MNANEQAAGIAERHLEKMSKFVEEAAREEEGETDTATLATIIQKHLEHVTELLSPDPGGNGDKYLTNKIEGTEVVLNLYVVPKDSGWWGLKTFLDEHGGKLTLRVLAAPRRIVSQVLSESGATEGKKESPIEEGECFFSP